MVICERFVLVWRIDSGACLYGNLLAAIPFPFLCENQMKNRVKRFYNFGMKAATFGSPLTIFKLFYISSNLLCQITLRLLSDKSFSL